jgi:REP element-mobilizing transposase RayT
LHGILVILGDEDLPVAGVKRKPLGRLIGAFKTVSTKKINLLRDTTGARFWQRNYYEHIVRDEEDLNRIRRYIAANPRRWWKRRGCR